MWHGKPYTFRLVKSNMDQEMDKIWNGEDHIQQILDLVFTVNECHDKKIRKKNYNEAGYRKGI